MADTLKTRLLDSAHRDDVVADLAALVDAEVKDKSGVSGTLIKGGYGAVKKVRPGIIPGTIDHRLDEFVDALEPSWTAYRTQPTPDFGAFLATRPREVSDALLAVTDRRAERSSRPAITSVYSKLRPKAQENVVEALPRLGRVVEKHARGDAAP
jgi:hypothetical protein